LKKEIDAFPKEDFDPDTPGAALIGNIGVQQKGLFLAISREIEFSKIFRGTPIENNPSFLGDTSFRYTIKLPKAASEHNAHSTENGGRTLHWSYLATDHFSQPVQLKMLAPIPLPQWLFPALIILALFLLILSFYAYQRFQRTKR